MNATPDPLPLRLDGRTVAEYRWRPDVPGELSPRPFLHPVRTLAGTAVSELMPEDHLHHLGVSVAVPLAGGANFWGGRTFVRGRGSTFLPNHGVQRHHRWTASSDTAAEHELRWTGPDGTELLGEHRRIAARPVDDRAWALDVEFALTNLTGAPLAFESPAVNGRPGAGYGGYFWRACGGDRRVRVLGPDGEGEAVLHGGRSRWLALVAAGADPWTLVFVGDPAHGDPWFVRASEYVGVGASLAWEASLVAEPGAGPRRRVTTVVADGALDAAAIAALARAVDKPLQ